VAGWANSVPVRVGNAAFDQRQRDSFSTVLDAIAIHLAAGARLTATTWSIVDRLATALARAPFEPTNGVWELRHPQRLVTDELARWIGLDKAERIRRRHRPWTRRPEWRIARGDAWARVDAALDPATGMLPRSFDGPMVVDAATLLSVIHGFYPRASEVAGRLVRTTIATLEQGAFLRRQPLDPSDPDTIEATFVPVSWWAVTALATIGDVEEATRRANEMCIQLPPLLSEEWSVERGESLGNTPLLWSHTETARSLYHLQQERIRRRAGTIGLRVWSVGRSLRLRLRRR
jgi:GH15 family glucan-1,4-alpha-glucosidase